MPKLASDEMIATRATLLLRLKNWQDQSSWQDFFDIYWSLIYDLAIKSGLTRVEAEDVVQETLLMVAKQIPTFKYDPSIGSFKSWLYKMTRWRIADQFRKRGVLNRLSTPEETDSGGNEVEKLPDPVSFDADQIWETEWEKNLLDSAMRKVRRELDPKKFQIFDFYVNKEWSPEKVAEVFEVSTSQVYLAKHRVTEMIKQEVGRLQKEIT